MENQYAKLDPRRAGSSRRGCACADFRCVAIQFVGPFAWALRAPETNGIEIKGESQHDCSDRSKKDTTALKQPSKQAEAILQAKDINIYYGENHAVKQLSLDINKNEILALIGPSGCGKSTFLRSINRMNDLIPSARVTGTLAYEGLNLLSDDVNVVALRKEIGMVFQKANPFPKSIYENLVHGLRFHNVKKKSGLTLWRIL